MPSSPIASILVPTRDRPGYLEIALASLVPQAREHAVELLVIDDGDLGETRTVAERHGSVVHASPGRGLNAARNAGVAAARGDLIVLVDDDVRAPEGWLAAILDGVAAAPEHDVFGGPIRAELEGGGPRRCGREGPPITSLDLGPIDRDVDLVWGANMALRRRAFTAVGPFDETIHGPGDEEEWELRIRASGRRIRYLADAGLVHRRTAADARLRRLVPAAYRQGRAARRHDERAGAAPALAGEMRTLTGCLWHIPRRRCAIGFVLAAHSAGRGLEAARGGAMAVPPEHDFQSGESGEVSGIRAGVRSRLADAVCDAIALARRVPRRVTADARTGDRRRVLVLAIERTDSPNLLGAAREELRRSRHEVSLQAKGVDGAGKFENLNQLLAQHPAEGYDWLLVVDDDVALPRGFLDRFLFLAERFDLALAQPAHRWRSHAAWKVTRRRPGLVARETRFVEIGPVTAFHARTFGALLPFPPLRFGWGLELHWSALARERGWREGVIDATPVLHGMRRVASAYTHEDAIAEARDFLAGHVYTPAAEAARTIRAHRDWPR